MSETEFEELKAHNKRIILDAFEIPEELARAWDEAHSGPTPTPPAPEES